VTSAASSPSDPPTAPVGRWAVLAGLRPAMSIWWASRLALFVVVSLTSYVLALPGPTRIHEPGGWLLERFVWWDAFHFLRIADLGYLPPGLSCCDQAFFPGYPLSIRVFAPLVGSSVLAGLLVTQLAASIAMWLLWRMATESSQGDRRAGDTAVLLFAVTPYGLFLSSVYSESLFLALCLAAWWAGERRHWWSAGVLTAAAAAVRVNGLFLAAALAVMYLLQLRADGRWRPRPDVAALLLPATVVLGYFGYLRARTGSWNDWQHAQVTAWHRELAWPWQGLQLGWHSLVTAPSNDLVITRAADLLTALAGLVLVGLLCWRRYWPEATFVALNLAVLICSTTLQSTPRYALMWFPAYLILARLSVRRTGRWVRPVALTAGPPFLVLFSMIFSIHLWVA